MFSRKDLIKLIVPLVIEQMLAVAVGMADSVMISVRGEAAMSGVSNVDTLNVLLINLFAALASGGAVVAAQYLGHKDFDKAKTAANQLVLSITVVSAAIMLFALAANGPLLRLIYGSVEPEVMRNSRIYFYITAASFPFLAVYNACASLFRAMGNSRISMQVSILMNLINITGNAIGLYVLGLGVEGVAYPTLISRAVAAVVMIILIRDEKNPLHIDRRLHLGFDPEMIKRILHIGVPNGLETSIFQIGKVMVQGLTASFGTMATAANAVASTVSGVAVIPGNAIGLAMITVVGQCVGANDSRQAKEYAKKLMKLTYLATAGINILLMLLLPVIIGLYHLQPETAQLARQIIIYYSICCMAIWPASFTLPNALRAASDVRFTMMISILSMWTFRIGFSYVLGIFFEMGVFGVWVAMTIDWLFRAICFTVRFAKGKWQHVFIG